MESDPIMETSLLNPIINDQSHKVFPVFPIWLIILRNFIYCFEHRPTLTSQKQFIRDEFY